VNDKGWTSAIGRYAERLHARAGDGHHVVSPLGAWMLVALCSTLAGEDQLNGLTAILGAEPGAAANFAAGLLSDPHPLVGAGAAAWVQEAVMTERVRQWRESLPQVVDTGDIPTVKQADTWAEERTLGLIKRFPATITPDVVCLLATALATKVSWEVPFAVVDAQALDPSPWAGQLQRVLRAPQGDPRHRRFIADTDRAGTVAVHLTGARGGLLVGSVIAADSNAPPGDVLAAAEAMVTAEARQRGSVDATSLFDLPLGSTQIWTITEEPAEIEGPDGRDERIDTVLPAWSADTELDLNDETLGFPAVARIVAAALELSTLRFEARQAAVARYSAVGFEAAAVTMLGIAMSSRTTRAGLRRLATVRFGHPFAVVAAVSDTRFGEPVSPWHGLPVFSAWVSEPSDAEAVVIDR
jgi:hypothetical protein